ncbi:hypothetical protein [Nocardioides sp. AX2bis]|uniref:hypothetical protein n=1 Tax=Nocardioides sp. AX2bis TaxID=2653157 RepID=UPI0012F1C865|nr:hypothetical protein [Nocardioides sp. AX2bis]VXB12823.1 conserved hypothetical protein [Nocardioides sp. AX2bis]
MADQSEGPGTHPVKTVYLHVGCRKSGTSALQNALGRSVEALEEQGLAQPLLGRGSTTRDLVEPLRTAAAGDPAPARAAITALADRIRASDRPRHLITLEAMAELPAVATAIVADGLAEFDTHVVVTARPWALTIPSEWQQQLKSRYTGEYVAYAEAVRDAAGATPEAAEEAALFRRRQDVGDVVRRWRAGARPLTVHVLLVPHDRTSRPDLLDLFCDLVGIDRAQLRVPSRVVNQSLSREDAEVLRRVNLALGDALTDLRGDYRYSVRKFIGVQAMMRRRRSPGGRIRLPRDLEDWAAQESRRQLDEVRAHGAEVVGDVDGFLRPTLPGDDHAPVTDAEAATAAAVVIAELAREHAKQHRQARRKAKQRRKAGGKKTGGKAGGKKAAGPTTPPSAGTPGEGAAATAAGEARRALRGARRTLGGLRDRGRSAR